MGLAANLVEGFAGAAGADNVVQGFENRKREKNQLSMEELKSNVGLYDKAIGDITTKLGTLQPGTSEHTQLQTALRQAISARTAMFHPSQAPSGIAKLGELLHIKQPQGQPQVQGAGDIAGLLAQGAPRGDSLSPEDRKRADRIAAGLEPRAAAPKSSNYAREDGVSADGRPMSIYRSKTDPSDALDSTGQPVDEAVLRGFKPSSKGAKGLKFDVNTDEVVNQDTGQRYARTAKNLPTDVDAMFKGNKVATDRKQTLAMALADARGKAFGQNRGVSVLDGANGNAPTEVTLGDMKKEPGRYMPSGPGAKALAAENQFQDIIGTSKLTRQAIDELKTDFPFEMKAKIALAMKADDPHSAIDQLMASGALGSLTEDQQNFLISTRQLAENAMAMRSILGAGQGSDDMRSAIRATLPSLLSPDRSYATRQLDAFDKTVARLHRGVPRVTLPETPEDAKKTLGVGKYKQTASGPGGHKIGSNDGGNTWFDIQTGKPVQ